MIIYIYNYTFDHAMQFTVMQSSCTSNCYSVEPHDINKRTVNDIKFYMHDIYYIPHSTSNNIYWMTNNKTIMHNT